MLKIIQKRKYLYVFSLALTGLSLWALLSWGLKFNIDFTGGTIMKLESEKDLSREQVSEALEDLNLGGLKVDIKDKEVNLKYLGSNDEINSQVFEKVKELDEKVRETSLDFIGSSVSTQLKKSAVWSVILGILGIATYIAWAFKKVSRPVASWKYGLGAVIALFHDILITTGAFAFLGEFYQIEIGVPFIAAILTVLGYSVNDTIVVYDRTRENLLRSGARDDFEDTVNRSLNEALARSINTSLTVIIVLIFMVLFGSEAIRWFSVALLIGVGFGTYSSIYVASALLVTIYKFQLKKK
ncbi:MAG: protein translocase subunit SecF [Patescibacteria group bacterium]